MASFTVATAIEQVDSHTYTANFDDSWVIGQVPHGGYVTASFQQVVRKHFSTTLRKQDQPHTIALHLDFLRRTETGPATFKIKDVKLGRQTSIVHVTLTQNSREEVVGYFTNSNLSTEAGPTFPTNWALDPPTSPINFSQLEKDNDPNWALRRVWPFAAFRKATTKILAAFPRAGQPSRSCIDQWMRFSDPDEKFTNESLGFVADMFPQLIEAHRTGGEDVYHPDYEKNVSPQQQEEREKGRAKFWYPTLLLNLEIKKALPKEGVEWLFVRTGTKVIRNGRYDLEVVVMDAGGEVVALSHHVVFVVGAERNTATRVSGTKAKM
ncbi:hypothetical protein MBLNU230_g8133t1 [Neophaeotheca triangularis]